MAVDRTAAGRVAYPGPGTAPADQRGRIVAALHKINEFVLRDRKVEHGDEQGHIWPPHGPDSRRGQSVAGEMAAIVLEQLPVESPISVAIWGVLRIEIRDYLSHLGATDWHPGAIAGAAEADGIVSGNGNLYL